MLINKMNQIRVSLADVFKVVVGLHYRNKVQLEL